MKGKQQPVSLPMAPSAKAAPIVSSARAVPIVSSAEAASIVPSAEEAAREAREEKEEMEVDQSADEGEETQTFLNMEKKPKRKKLTDTVTKQLYYRGPDVWNDRPGQAAQGGGRAVVLQGDR